MPYIDPIRRAEMLPNCDGDSSPRTPGELNFAITVLCQEYLRDTCDKRTDAHGLAQPKLSYAKLNEVVGVLECAKLEMYRRQVAPYEDIKMAENGDCYPVER